MPTDVSLIHEGAYRLVMACPECDRTVTVPVELSPVLTVNSDGGSLRPRLVAKKVDHACDNTEAEALPFPDTDG